MSFCYYLFVVIIYIFICCFLFLIIIFLFFVVAPPTNSASFSFLHNYHNFQKMLPSSLLQLREKTQGTYSRYSNNDFWSPARNVFQQFLDRLSHFCRLGEVWTTTQTCCKTIIITKLFTSSFYNLITKIAKFEICWHVYYHLMVQQIIKQCFNF